MSQWMHPITKATNVWSVNFEYLINSCFLYFPEGAISALNDIVHLVATRWCIHKGTTVQYLELNLKVCAVFKNGSRFTFLHLFRKSIRRSV